jgi:2-methylisocitrate lyase-like PEP mutase family enzyme
MPQNWRRAFTCRFGRTYDDTEKKDMTSQTDRALAFAKLHKAGDPIILYNIWDAGSARAVEKAGAKAIATGSWSVAAAQGFADGQHVPLDVLVGIAGRIVHSVDLPVSIDVEGAYAVDPQDAASNVLQIIGTGAVGINFEDQIVGGKGIHEVAVQCQRIGAIRAAAEHAGVPLFINARLDAFLKADAGSHADVAPEALDRAKAFCDAAASGIFLPGLGDERLIGTFCKALPLPVNIMMFDGAPGIPRLADLGVARVSFGPGPFRAAMARLADEAQKILGEPK